MNQLPVELVHRILEYDGRIKYRHGKYMNQIAQDDDRYKMLQSIPQMLPFPNRLHYWYMIIVDTSNKIYCEKTNASYAALSSYGEKVHLILTKSNTEKIQYIFIHQGCYYNFIIYKYKTPPTFIVSIFQNLYDLCFKFI